MGRDPVVIVGASVAGLFAAKQLAHMGVPVRVFERTEHVVPRERTLIVTVEMQRVLGFSAERAIVNAVKTLHLCAGDRKLQIDLREPDLIVERADLIQVLTQQAIQAGAQLEFGKSFVGIERDGPRSHVVVRQRGTDKTQRVAASVLLAADGVRSHVARHLGQPPRPTVTVLQARVVTPPSADNAVGCVWFVPKDTRYFYWLCPEAGHTAAVGIVDENPKQARAKLDRFLLERGLEPFEYQSALIPLYRPNPSPATRVGSIDVMFVGDAAGQVKVTTVGGTVTGLRGAQSAVRAITRRTLYARELATVERELRLHWRIRALMNRFSEQEYEAVLQLLAGRAGRLLEIHNRDSLTHAFWSILAVQPRLPLLAAQVLWRVGLSSPT